jgi:broad specificity phosphatase PhoE
MHVILIRHGEPCTVETAGEPADPGLTERGRWQAQRVSEWLACEPIDAIVTSSKTRAIETVEPLVGMRGLEPSVVADLDEIDRRSTVYAPFQVMAQRFPDYWQAIQEQRWADIGWDSFEEFERRVVAAWEGLIARPPGAHIAVGCHGGVIGVILAHITGITERWSFANPPFASCARIDIAEDGRAQVLSMNETGHFDAMRDHVVGTAGEGFAEPDASPPGEHTES